MGKSSGWIAAALIAWSGGGLVAAQGDPRGPAAVTTSPSVQAPMVPEGTIKEIGSLFVPPDGDLLPAETVAANMNRMEKVLRLGADAESRYPGAANLPRVHKLMLHAASFLASQRNDAAVHKQLTEIAEKLLAAPIPAEEKFQADLTVTRAKVVPPSGPFARAGSAPGANADKEIQAFVQRYADTRLKASALIGAIDLSGTAKEPKLREALARKLEAECLDQPAARSYLRNELGRHPDIGRPFEAELTRLNGSKLVLPGDLSGKAAVIFFWDGGLTCAKVQARLKDLYRKHKDAGLEIVGISLDDDKTELQKNLKADDPGWIQTFSDDRKGDPTARKYGVDSAPSVWVLDRAGKVVSDDAAKDLEAIVEKVLVRPTTGPGR
jgi:peroxiredoxin